MTAGGEMPSWGVSVSPLHTAVLSASMVQTQSRTEAAHCKACLLCRDTLLLAQPPGISKY